MKRLIKALNHCLNGEECEECSFYEQNSILSCRKLLQAVYEQIKEYEELEEQGKLLKLPCAVGDTLYTNLSMQGWRFKKKDRPYKVKVVFVGINGVDNCIHVAFDNGCMFQFWFSDIGKTIFLTQESAESALKEMGE